MPIERADVGCWVVRGNADAGGSTTAAATATGGTTAAGSTPATTGPASQEWCLARTYRSRLVEPGDLVVRYLGGQKTPGIVELGRVTHPVAPAAGDDKPVVRYAAVALREPVTRQVLKDDPVLSGCELIRLGRAANPLHLTPEETLALTAYLETKDLERAGWPQRRAENPFTPSDRQD
ncbi:EVE domain-containing protein [Serinicoccus chungangensis]|uniref:EVE domain-containing protein n=1 Tax=Serinicoccus chungangensis TaxID=767452 RepID=UPI00111B74AD|nr:EVE domain-containing protein [Serinicoccus chungangensis]